MRFRKYLSVKFACFLLFACLTTGLQAEETINDILLQENVPAVTQAAGRPLRNISSDEFTPEPLLPLPVRYSSFIIPENMNRRLTLHYIERYSNPSGIALLNRAIRNADIFLPYIKSEITRRGLPPELAYLPVIESEFIVTAVSRSGATGLWQFMMNSIGNAMKVNELVDERMDFRKSTNAALAKLESDFRSTGSWPMALASYNAGLGAARRAAQRAGTNCYWEICEKEELPSETIHFVPKFLAVSYILSNPRKYNVNYWPETVELTAIKPVRQVSLDIIASETGTNRDLLTRLNRELLFGITPPDANYELVVPSAGAESIKNLLARPDIALLRYYRYQIKHGDTLSALSRHYGVSINMIDQHNPGIRNRYLRIGEIINIPAFRDVAPYVNTVSAPSPAVRNTATGLFTGTYTVVAGDTLWSIASRHRVDPSVLARENNMELNSILSIGKVLKVPIME